MRPDWSPRLVASAQSPLLHITVISLGYVTAQGMVAVSTRLGGVASDDPSRSSRARPGFDIAAIPFPKFCQSLLETLPIIGFPTASLSSRLPNQSVIINASAKYPLRIVEEMWE